MKKIIILVSGLIVFNINISSQNILKPAPRGFDSLNIDIQHGKIDSLWAEDNLEFRFR